MFAFIPLTGPPVGGVDSRSSSVIIWIDTDGRVASYSASQSQYGVGAGPDRGQRERLAADAPRSNANYQPCGALHGGSDRMVSPDENATL